MIFAETLADLTAPLVDAALDRPAPAIGAAAGYTPPAMPVSPRRAVAILRAIAADISSLDVIGAEAEAVRLAGWCAALGHAVRASIDIAYESRQEAEAMRRALDADLAAAAEMAADAALGSPSYGAALWGALTELRSRLSHDMHEIIGRLPAVILVAPPHGISTWLIAQHVAGDDPRDVIAMFEDVVRRNRLRHPGLITDETIEVLP